MIQQIIISYWGSSDLKQGTIVYENMQELKQKIEELSNGQDVKSIELVFEEYE